MKESEGPKGYAVDHIVPASEPAALIHSWDNFFARLTVPAETGLQVLCHPCHDHKTKSENRIRKSAMFNRPKTKRRKSTPRLSR
jgi:5-methylcytosine-specific restriction endonuclease McrA